MEAPEGLEGYVAERGPFAWTVFPDRERRRRTTRGINLIPHTWDNTTFRDRTEGDVLNLEVDLLARYVGRLLETQTLPGPRYAATERAHG